MAGRWGALALFLFDGISGFSETVIALESHSYSGSTADVDNDGDIDILDRELWYENMGDGTLAPPTAYYSPNTDRRRKGANDLDLDGDLDLITSVSDDGAIYWMENDGSLNSAAEALIYEGHGIPQNIRLSDVDNDGDKDMITRGYDQRILLLTNNTSLGQEGCVSDLSGDNQVDVTDFLQINSAFGNDCDGCPEDIDGSGTVDVGDFIIMNSAFGDGCE